MINYNPESISDCHSDNHQNTHPIKTSSNKTLSLEYTCIGGGGSKSMVFSCKNAHIAFYIFLIQVFWPVDIALAVHLCKLFPSAPSTCCVTKLTIS
jgi:hypothetical protein